MTKTKLFQIGFIAAFAVLLLLIITTPHLVQSGVQIDDVSLGREIVQEILIVFLLAMLYVVYRVYKATIRKQLMKIKELELSKDNLEKELMNVSRYLGKLNAQMETFDSIISDIKKYPKNKKDLKKVCELISIKILGLVPGDWVLIRLVDADKQKTLREHSQARGRAAVIKAKIGNKELIEDRRIDGHHIIDSGQKDINVRAYCVVPSDDLGQEQKTLIRSLLKQLELMFLIVSSKYYRQ